MASSEDRREPADTGLVERTPAFDRWDGTRWSWRDRFVRWLLVEHAEPLPSFQEPLEDPPGQGERPRIGICCSGGGIRSASFNLGALQEIGLTRLQDAKYLAAVSGGSYIAAAYAMVASTRKQPSDDDSDAELMTTERPPFYPGSPEEQYLRNRVSYMAPSGGGKLRLVWRIACGLLVNLVLIASATAVLASLVAAYYSWGHSRSGDFASSPDPWIWGGGVALAAIGLALGVLHVLVRPIDDRWSRRAEAWSLRLALLGVILLALEAGLPELLRVLQEGTGLGSPEELVGGGLGGTAGGILAAVLLQLRARAADAKAAIEGVDRHAGRLARLAPRVRRLVINLAAYVLGPLLIACMFIGALLVQVNDSWSGGFAIVAMLTFAGLYALADLTSWSLHPFYRRRLCTAFALKRVKRLGVDGTELEQDSVGRAVEREQGKFVKLSDTSVVPCWADAEWPTLIVCAAANVSDPGATPPGRSVTSFTFSAEAMGGPLVGGIRTEEFEKRLHERRQRDFNLPAVVAMSGAALSPSMGKLTRPSLRFLMGLANVRLGVWVPNPRRYDEFVKTPKAARQISPKSGSKTLKRPSVRDLSADERARVRETAERRRVPPRPRPIYLLKELLGKTSVNDPYLYITDGGHYENLGLVELLRRGCTRIYCFDASGGRELNELGDAIALARTELGVELEFERSELDLIKEGEDGFAERACARGTIRYTRGKQAVGTIVYARTVMAREVPLDLHSFKARDDVFPHHSTVDQLFTDQKFEAYRVLGQHAAAAAIEAMESSRTEEPAPKAPAPAPVHPVELGRRVLEATRRRAVPR